MHKLLDKFRFVCEIKCLVANVLYKMVAALHQVGQIVVYLETHHVG